MNRAMLIFFQNCSHDRLQTLLLFITAEQSIGHVQVKNMAFKWSIFDIFYVMDVKSLRQIKLTAFNR